MAEAGTPQIDGDIHSNPDGDNGDNADGAGFVGSFFTPEFIEDPYPSYRFLLEHQPLFQVPDAPLHIATRYEDCQTLLRDRRLGHAFKAGMIAEWGERVFEENAIYRPPSATPSFSWTRRTTSASAAS